MAHELMLMQLEQAVSRRKQCKPQRLSAADAKAARKLLLAQQNACSMNGALLSMGTAVDNVGAVDLSCKGLIDQSTQPQLAVQHVQLIERLYSHVLNQTSPGQHQDSLHQTLSLLLSPSSEADCQQLSTASSDTIAACDEQSVVCALCEQTCDTRMTLLWHSMAQHAMRSPFTCAFCQQTFPKRTTLQVHYHNEHKLGMQLAADRPATAQLDTDNDATDHRCNSVPAEIYFEDVKYLERERTSAEQSQMDTSLTEAEGAGGRALDLRSGCSQDTLHRDRGTSSLSISSLLAPSLPTFVPVSTPTLTQEQEEALMSSSEEDWEQLMEFNQTDEMAKVREIVGDRPVAPACDPNQCLICRRILSCKSALQMHYRTHTGERPFKCRICARAFTTKGNLKTHMGVHRGKPPSTPLRSGSAAGDSVSGRSITPTSLVGSTNHKCAVCQKQFGCVSSLHQHMALHVQHNLHPNIMNHSPEPSPQSQSNETSPIDMKPAIGIQMHRPGPWQLNGTHGVMLPELGPYQQIMMPTASSSSNGSTTTCNVCFKTFACNSALDIHYRFHECVLFRSHTKERPFRCDLCGRGFSTKGNMKQHLLTHKIRDNGGTGTGDVPQSGNNTDDSRPVSQCARSPVHSIQSDNGAGNGNVTGTLEEDKRPLRMDSRPQSQPKHSDNATIRWPSMNISDMQLVTAPEDIGSLNSLTGPSPLESIQKMWAKTEPAPPRQMPVLSKHQCGVCYKHFSSSSALQIHMRTHTGDKPFKCNVCARAFTTKGNLKVHMGTHVWQTQNRRGRRIFDSASGESPPASNDMPSPLFLSQPSPEQLALPPGLPPSFAFPPRVPFPGPALPVPFGVRPPPPPFGLGFMPAAQRLEQMMMMWRTVCSVCHKVCASSNELEQHLKEHLVQGHTTTTQTSAATPS